MTKKIYRAYGLELPLINVPPLAKLSSRAPTVNDKDFSVGQIWIHKTADTASSYVFCNTKSNGDAIWALQSPSESEIEEVGADSGDNIEATDGVIVLAGGTNIATVASDSPATITFNLDDAISLSTSVTSPLYTAPTATDLALDAAVDKDILIKLGDDVAANKISFINASAAEVASLSSTGTLTAANIDGIIGSTTPAAGAFTTVEASTSVTSPLVTADQISTSGICIPVFTQNSMVNSALNTGVEATGSTGDVNNVLLQTGVNMNAFVIGAGQTILQPIMTANGLEIGGDKAASEGYEYNLPYHKFTIGTSAAFFFELGLYINDMDGAAPFVFGFRKEEANNGTFSSYTDYVSIGMNAVTSATNIVTLTDINSSGQTATDSTTLWGGDAATNILSVFVSAAGVVTYAINGTPYAGAGFTFDNGDVVIPFIRVEQSASPTDIAITSMKIGYQA